MSTGSLPQSRLLERNDFHIARHPPAIADLADHSRANTTRDFRNDPAPSAVISDLQGCVLSAAPGFDSDKRQWVSLPTKVDHGLSHIGNVRSAISTTRCNLLRLAPPAA